MNPPSALSPLARVASQPWLQGTLLFGTAFVLATKLHPEMSAFAARRPDSGDPLTALLGDGRRLFANHFYVKADVYFHSGFYPTVFDNQESHQTAHIAEDAGVSEGQNTGDEEHFLGPPRDWIDAHGRKHFPSVHTHLGEDSPDKSRHAEREILPWLKLASRLDPNKIESYTVAAYWLRQTGKPVEAEEFLREGLRANPDSPEILFELGRSRADAQDETRARHLLELAWSRWRAVNDPRPAEAQDRFLAGQILMRLAAVEVGAGRREVGLRWMERLVPLKPDPTELLKRIAEVKSGQPLVEAGPGSER